MYYRLVFLITRRPHSSTLLPCATLFFFFFNDTATTEIYTLSLHDALPISERRLLGRNDGVRGDGRRGQPGPDPPRPLRDAAVLRLQHGRLLEALARHQKQSQDRKSTRLNSSHTVISYAVFCLRSEEHTSEL